MSQSPQAPETTAPLVVEWPKAGEIVDVARSRDFRDRLMLLAPCAPAESSHQHQYFCENCKTLLANRGQLDLHLDNAAGVHRIVAYCTRRLVYVPVLPDVVAAVGGVTP